jgi:hypothetical protein
MHAQGRFAVEDDEQLLAAVVEVIDDLSVTRLDLPDGGAETAGAFESKRSHAAPVQSGTSSQTLDMTASSLPR